VMTLLYEDNRPFFQLPTMADGCEAQLLRSALSAYKKESNRSPAKAGTRQSVQPRTGTYSDFDHRSSVSWRLTLDVRTWAGRKAMTAAQLKDELRKMTRIATDRGGRGGGGMGHLAGGNNLREAIPPLGQHAGLLDACEAFGVARFFLHSKFGLIPGLPPRLSQDKCACGPHFLPRLCNAELN